MYIAVNRNEITGLDVFFLTFTISEYSFLKVYFLKGLLKEEYRKTGGFS